MPGTAYKIYGGIAVLVILLILIIRLIVKWRAVMFWFKNSRLKRRYARSKKNTIKALKKLQTEYSNSESNHENDSQLCTRLQKIIREYLELRLEYPFTKKLTSELSLAFNEATCGLADESRTDAFEDIISVFVRTDFIRFSDSARARFKDDEFTTLVNNLIKDIEVIECENKDESEGGKNA